jgi:hypothetical protein
MVMMLLLVRGSLLRLPAMVTLETISMTIVIVLPLLMMVAMETAMVLMLLLVVVVTKQA